MELLCVVDRRYLNGASSSRVAWIRLFFIAHALSFEQLVKSVSGHRGPVKKEVIATV